jgi:hypothetical protein
MRLTEETVTALNYQLDDLNVAGTSRFELSDYNKLNSRPPGCSKNEYDVLIAKYISTLRAILIILRHYNDTISIDTLHDTSSIADVRTHQMNLL